MANLRVATAAKSTRRRLENFQSREITPKIASIYGSDLAGLPLRLCSNDEIGKQVVARTALSPVLLEDSPS